MDKRKQKKITDYFRAEKRILVVVTITGILYNVGMLAGPWFEGQLAGCLYDIIRGVKDPADIWRLSAIYVGVIAFVQFCRYLKRLYVRRFANNVTRSMKESVYRHLLSQTTPELENTDTGGLLTRAVSDCESCAEGMRKFTTEIFDTGVVMISYLVMLFWYDWRLTLIVILFPPIAYLASEKLKGAVTSTVAAAKKSMSGLNGMTTDRVSNALTYRVYGEEKRYAASYEEQLGDYERRNIRAGVLQNAPQPLYLVISMIGVIPILLFGSHNVLGTGWTAWTIASFSTYVACFAKLATKSSHAAKLFNAVQKARVSWNRIRDLVNDCDPKEGRNCFEEEPDSTDRHETELVTASERKTSDDKEVHTFKLHNTGFSYPDSSPVFSDFSAAFTTGEIVGLTGPVACGKSSFGRMFLGEYPWTGTITFDGEPLEKLLSGEKQVIAYMGHQPELFSDTVRSNVCMGNTRKTEAVWDGNATQLHPYGSGEKTPVRGERAIQCDEQRLAEVLHEVRMDGEVTPDTLIGSAGMRLSGGQQARIALARALYSDAPILILDDPFASVDRKTEEEIFTKLRQKEKDRIIFILSHRLDLFPELDQVLWMEGGQITVSSHEKLYQSNPDYRKLYDLQRGGHHA